MVNTSNKQILVSHSKQYTIMNNGEQRLTKKISFAFYVRICLIIIENADLPLCACGESERKSKWLTSEERKVPGETAAAACNCAPANKWSQISVKL